MEFLASRKVNSEKSAHAISRGQQGSAAVGVLWRAGSDGGDVCAPVRVCVPSVSIEIWQRGTFFCQRATL